jgi:N-acetylneuraminate synthase
MANAKFRRSLYFVKDMEPGDIIDISNIRSVRPGFGMAPKEIDKILNKRVKIKIQKNTPVEAWKIE